MEVDLRKIDERGEMQHNRHQRDGAGLRAFGWVQESMRAEKTCSQECDPNRGRWIGVTIIDVLPATTPANAAGMPRT